MTGSEPTTGAQGRIYLSTRFGEFEVEERDVLTFPEGLPGLRAPAPLRRPHLRVRGPAAVPGFGR